MPTGESKYGDQNCRVANLIGGIGYFYNLSLLSDNLQIAINENLSGRCILYFINNASSSDHLYQKILREFFVLLLAAFALNLRVRNSPCCARQKQILVKQAGRAEARENGSAYDLEADRLHPSIFQFYFEIIPKTIGEFDLIQRLIIPQSIANHYASLTQTIGLVPESARKMAQEREHQKGTRQAGTQLAPADMLGRSVVCRGDTEA